MAEIHENANPTESTTAAIMPDRREDAVLEPEPDQVADADHEQHSTTIVAHEVRRRPADEDGRAGHRERAEPVDEPYFRSSARPIAVVVDPKIAFCTKMPGIRNFT